MAGNMGLRRIKYSCDSRRFPDLLCLLHPQAVRDVKSAVPDPAKKLQQKASANAKQAGDKVCACHRAPACPVPPGTTRVSD